ncbi:hypothetical protein NUH86_00910 [Sphingobium sp. JS3065]|uniref:hypothetical protein n=1 Tax=Sphingobium sp. JS3065 TaxID=2970925 RepID=UPI002264D3C7|nr:hypothetical protein [Sphingobium sp. JS3065]UZW55396.1 hypothetical protein NUH86_00910 [Sphingobium sp. JS3065]
MNQRASGRPIRFFGLLMIGWVAIRLASQWGDLVGEAKEDSDGGVFHPTAYAKKGAASAKGNGLPAWRNIAAPRQRQEPSRIAPRTYSSAPPAAGLTTGSAFIPSGQTAEKTEEAAPAINPAPALPLAYSASIDRWHGSAWLLWREGSATRADAVTGGRLGGSQAGVRLDFDLTPHASSRATAYGRTSAALNSPASPEGAIGLAWQPTRTVPIGFAAERRIALGKGGRNANAVMAVGGFGPAQIAPSLEVEAYAQGGMVGFRSRDLFVDGKMSLLSPVSHSPLRIGVSLSGGAQPQVERLDIGPELQVRLPLKPVSARLGVEWRERVAGQAAPASGLAITLGADF